MYNCLSLSLNPLSLIHYHYLSEKNQCFTTFKRKLKIQRKLKIHLFHIHLCCSASVSFWMYHSGGVCMCVWVCVCVCLCVIMSWGYLFVPWYSFLVLWGFFVCLFFNCLVGCFSMIVWTPAVLSVLYACVLYFCIYTCSAQLSMFHIEGRSRNTLIMIIIVINCLSRSVPKIHLHSAGMLANLPTNHCFFRFCFVIVLSSPFLCTVL